MKIGLKYLICVIVMLSIALPAYADSDDDFMSDGWELAKDLNYTVAFYAGESSN